jgi:Transglutaminase-like superfamily
MFIFVSKAYWKLLQFELDLQRGQFNRLYQRVKTCSIHATRSRKPRQEDVLRAVDLACALYFKKVLCLQRAAATTCLLREAGIPAELVIGVRTLPYCAHAWVEVEGTVVNDKSYTPQIYSALSRC